MRMFVISDNSDTLTGLSLAGVDGVVVHTKEETIAQAKKAVLCDEYAIILVTSKLKALCNEYFSAYMERHTRPLFLEIPDRHGDSRPNNSINEFIEKSIGLKIKPKSNSQEGSST